MKLLVFTEHKDTLDHLAGGGRDDRPRGKLRQWGLTVTQIHGGLLRPAPQGTGAAGRVRRVDQGRPLREPYSTAAASAFGPLELKTWNQRSRLTSVACADGEISEAAPRAVLDELTVEIE
jgi:hypothetical protein